MADLSIDFCGVKIKNPIVAASAEPTLNAHNMKKCIDAGAGGVIVKTMSDSPDMRELTTRSKWRFLNEKHEVACGKVPRAFSLYGRSGLALEPPDEFLPEIEAAVKYAADHDAVVIGSIGSVTTEGWVTLAKQIEQTGVSLLECNFGCPHPHMMPGVKTGMEVGQDFEYACNVTRKVCEAVDIPVMIKVTPQVPSLIEFTGDLMDAGARAVTLTNRFIGFVPDIETGKPLIYGKAGCGGPWIKPLTLRWIHDIRQHYKDRNVFIAGTNGAYDWRDVVMFMMSGAHIVEMCSAVMVYGYEWLGRQVRGLEKWMNEKGYGSVNDFLGVATDASMAYSEMPHEKARVNAEVCTNCGRCLKACFYQAMQPGDESTWVEADNCIGCGGCYSVCPVKGAVDIFAV